MSLELASKFCSVWSSHDSIENCGHAPFKALEDGRELLTTILDKSTGSSSKDQEQRKPSNTVSDLVNQLIYQSDFLLDYARAMLHAYPYRDVPACWRELYTDAGILKALALALGYFDSSDSLSNSVKGSENSNGPLKLAIAVCDNVLVMAGASGAGRKPIIFDLIAALESRIEGLQDISGPSVPKRQKTRARLGEEDTQSPMPKIRYSIPRVHLPTMDAFQRHVCGSSSGPTPIVITGAMNHWPARERWTDLDTLCRIAGPDRLVPIEIGRQYTDEQWTQKLVTMREFIEQYILLEDKDQDRTHGDDKESEPQIGYLAQHDLFDQIPRLRRDIDIPDYCLVEPQEEEGYHPPDDMLLNAWFGPRGTISPMHTDPYHNLLAQVVGKKYVRLYAPKETQNLYCYGSGHEKESMGDQQDGKEATMLNNTSQVDVEHPDLERHPRFADAQYVETILEPGELLYIPFQWWHYIRSLSTSFSVSFWF
ncbi:Lysine-specific demethylase 8 [Mortierella polycephala]|uniref:Lysine-specific demethylase 8 n=1 Tax=Mortierella polycephala TaxID=41804 RepID=A0A9P6PQ83_9FUNG|nr:Lysine-specific demethylase 8 [Mortierella polycephala]